jgi:hypothetical protein
VEDTEHLVRVLDGGPSFFLPLVDEAARPTNDCVSSPAQPPFVGNFTAQTTYRN